MLADPFERGDSSFLYNDWMVHRVFLAYGAQAVVANWLQSFKDFPIRQKPASFNLDEVMRKLSPSDQGISGNRGVMMLKKQLFRWIGFLALTLSPALSLASDPLPSWNKGPAKESILSFVEKASKEVPVEERVAVFDNDGTLWSEQPVYFQLAFALDRVKALAKQHPEWNSQEPFKSVLSGDLKAVMASGEKGLMEIIEATHAGMTTAEFSDTVREWLKTAKHPRFKRPYTDLVFQPMLELLSYLRSKGFKTFIASGGGIEFMRVFSEKVYGIPPEQVIGTAGIVKYGYDKEGKPFLTKEPKLLLNDNDAGKPEGIHLMIGRRPLAAFGNSTGDRQMLEYTKAGQGSRLAVLLLHDDAKREYAYGPAEGLPDTHVGALTQALYDQAKAEGWLVISMKQDWKQVFAFDP